ncbi:sensor histidine kinase [Devosia psychrophila]|uniref:histidine kinase n=1 Tax=Devosia psychrophila TaxID=728005 RepID=A0A0F5PSN8_9HYPH|nr:sensor histidine kinase KdpD [Devosia psychrophila]KKC31421.1 histidine kinase [Devosia psychrophila]SFC94255.1 two-component system, OmpR family, sensor histidine kinase KdpD [Devosia psychrophila]
MARHTEKERPDPTALLQLAAREGRGKLTVFLGAAPGVGKTYAMLERARGLKAQGVDVVIGLVETHGRGETARLAEGLETLPRQGEGDAYREFDLDAALARRPALLIVDELAHSNAPGSRHPKRHQDIAELIHAGINVWTALNIQHLESLSDLVARIAGIPVRETVPDIVLKTADEVILVDLPPAELIARLNEGKVYLPDNAARALDGFFKPATLTALRELALRRAADRVDDQMVEFLRQSAVEGPWATGERLLVCVGPDTMSEKVVRTASRLASGLNARWLVVSLNRPDAALPSPADAVRLEEVLRLAERFGAETRRESASDFVDAILRIARREHITQIVIGRPTTTRWLRRSLPDALLRQAGEIGVHVVPGATSSAGRKPRRRLTLPEWALTLGLPLVSVGATTIFGLGLTALVALQNLSMLYLAAVLVSAVIAGRGSALVAAALSFAAYNFFFIEPTGALTVAQPQEVLSLVIFVAVAFAAGQLAARLREQADLSRQQARQSQALLDFSRKLSGAHGQDSVFDAIASHLHTSLGRPAVVLVPDDSGDLDPAAAWPPEQALDGTELTAARWAFDKKEPAGFLTGTLPQVRYLFRPIIAAQRILGVAGLGMGPRDVPLAADEERTLIALLDQAAIAMDRARLNRESAMASVAREGEKVQAALLSSLSHDLRTPLASITGAVTTLRQLGEKLPVETREDLLLSIEEESVRLNRFVANLFDMTRIEAGMMKARREAIDLNTVVASSVARAKRLHPDLLIDISLAPNLPSALGDGTLLEQVLFNLLDNARKYGAAEQPVSIFAKAEDGHATISVTDQGKGIPEADLEKIFEKFYRRAKSDGRPAGTGLGLSIARGLMTAMGGTIKATSPAVRKRGTRFTLRLPLATKEE